MRVAILGPVEITDDGDTRAIEAPKERAVLEVLALRVGSPVPSAVLIEALWGDDPPATAEKTLQSHVSRLRRIVGPERLVGDASGYTLQLDPDCVDVHRFERLIDESSAAFGSGQLDEAVVSLSEALDLWRGDPFTDLSDGDLRRGQSTRMEELRLLATERRIDAELELGRHDALVAPLEVLVAENPLRESLWGQLMLALYRARRQAEALRSFQRLRSTLAEELGIEPSPELARLEQRILRQDPQLDPEPPPPPGNLPSATSSFIGRVDDVRDIVKAIDENRLVTLVGPGGVGKTRLALRAAGKLAESFDDGVWWFDLAAVREPRAVAPRVAGTLGITPAPGFALIDALRAHVRTREFLFVLDNCEHLVETVAELVTRLLESGPAVTVLATSRLPLGVGGELRRPVVPLATPPSTVDESEVLMYDAARLFLERADSAGIVVTGADLHVVGEICRHLDGIPLAVEVAAARSSILSPTELRDRLEQSLDTVGTVDATGDPRYHNLRAAIDWSYDLLDPRGQCLFDRLGVFPGDFDLAAAEVVGACEDLDATEVLDVLGHLVDASMVTTTAGSTGGRRFRLLETMTEYGLEHLQDEEKDEARRRHSAHYRALAGDTATALDGPDEASALAVLDLEDHNLRAAIEWSLAYDPASTTLEFGRAVGLAWYVLGDFAECCRLLENLLERTGDASAEDRAWALCRLIWPAFLGGDGSRAWSAAEEALVLARAAGNPTLISLIQFALGHMLTLGAGDTDGAIPYYDESAAVGDEAGLTFLKAWPLIGMAQAIALGDHPDDVGPMLDEAESVLVEAGDHFRLAHVCLSRWLAAWRDDDLDAIVAAAEEGLRHSRAAHSTMYEQISIVGLGTAAFQRGDLDGASVTLMRAARLALDDGNLLQLGVALQSLSALAAVRGRSAGAARLFGASTTLAPFWPLMWRRLGPYLDRARTELGADYDREVEAGTRLTPAEAVALASVDGG